jgi:hypothetical protein
VIKRAGYQRMAAHNAMAQHTDEERGMQQAAALAGGGGLRGRTSLQGSVPLQINAKMQAIRWYGGIRTGNAMPTARPIALRLTAPSRLAPPHSSHVFGLLFISELPLRAC